MSGLTAGLGLFTVCLLAMGAGCTRTAGTDSPAADTAEHASSTGVPTAGVPVAAQRPKVVALGDSLTAGLGLDPSDAYPAVLQRLVDAEGYDYEVVNMGVSGDTSAGGLSRLEWALTGDVRVLVVALGGNDGLRGLSPDDLAHNLGAIIDRAQAGGIHVILCGMEAPPNLGDAYTRAFRSVYPRLARDRGVELVPFLLDGVAGNPSLNQADGIHPTAEGARRVADLVWARLEPILLESSPR